MTVSLIVACDAEYGIGKNGSMPWHFPADFAYFKQITMGHPMVTGRKNFEDMGVLPGRQTMVVTTNPNWQPKQPGVLVDTDIYMAIERCKWADACDGSEVFIVGGGQIYEQVLKSGLVDKIYLTHIPRATYNCDVLFPAHYLHENFNESHRTVRYEDQQNEERLEFIVYTRRRGDQPRDKKKTQ